MGNVISLSAGAERERGSRRDARHEAPRDQKLTGMLGWPMRTIGAGDRGLNSPEYSSRRQPVFQAGGNIMPPASLQGRAIDASAGLLYLSLGGECR